MEFSSNAATESIYLDNIMFYSDGLDLDLDDDNDGYLDVNDDCPFDAAEHVDTDGDGFADYGTGSITALGQSGEVIMERTSVPQ